MTKRYVSPHIEIDFGHSNPEWNRIRTSEEMQAHLEARGQEWTARLNGDLRSAQAQRKQPIEDGYDHNVNNEGSRARLYVWPFTARAIAHEAVNQAMLKLVPIGDIKEGAGPKPEVPRELGRRGNVAQGHIQDSE